MALYLGNKHISEFYLGDKKIKEAYIGNKKVYPESASFEEIPDSANSLAGDVLFYDNTEQKKIIFRASDFTGIDTSRYTPIGVVVVPGTHNVYGDGSCGVISLKFMNCNTPNNGNTSPQNMCWGIDDIPSLSSFDSVPVGNTSDGLPTEIDNSGFLPSDEFSSIGFQCNHDSDVYYSKGSTIPSPYLTDGSRNPGYYQISSPSSINNCLSNFDGKDNTNKILEVRGTKDYSSWKPTSSSQDDCPAASCCDMFYTKGTQQGDWYLPAMGELGYIMPSLNKINETITNLQNIYGSSVGVDIRSSIWSSTLYYGGYARTLATSNGAVNVQFKSMNEFVRAFLKYNSSFTIDFKIIFTDSEGNTYDQLAFKNINTNEIITPKLCINGLDGGNYTGNSLVDDTVTEYLDSINSALERGDHTGNPTFLYIAAIREENNTLSNSLNSIRGISLDLRKVINSGTDTEVDIDSIEQGIDYQPAGISPGYELVGRKNGTGDIITICGDVDEKKITVNKATIQNNIVRLYLNFNGTTTPIESEFSIIMEPSLSFTDTFTTPNGLTLNKNGNYEASMSQLEYDNYLNEDGFYPLTFGTEVLQDWYFYDALSVAIFQEHTEDSSVAIPNGKVTIYDTSDYNFITGDYISSSSYEIYELYLNNNVTNKEEVSLYAGHSIGRIGMIDSKGKEYKFEFRIPNKTNEPEFTDGYFRYKFRFQDSDEFIGFANENSGTYHTNPVIGLATSASELTSDTDAKNNTVLCMNTGTFVNNSSSSASGNTDIIENQWFRTTQVIDPQSWIDQGFSWIGFLIYGTTYPFAFVMPLDFVTKATENEVYEFSSSEISQIKSVTLDYRTSLAHGLQYNSTSMDNLCYPTGNTTLNPRVQAVSFDKLNNTLIFILRSW